MLEPVLFHRLKNETNPGKLGVAAEFLSQAKAPFRQETLDQILADLTRSFSGGEAPALRAWAVGLAANASTAYVCARLAADSGDLASAAAHWERFFALTPERDPFILLAYARVLSALGRFEEAALTLRRALLPPPRYAFFTRAEKLIRDVAAGIDSDLRNCRIAVLGAGTTSLLIPVLSALCLRDRIRAEFYDGLYVSIDQEILDPESGMARFRPDIVVILTHGRSLQLPATGAGEAGSVREILESQKSRWQKLNENLGCHVVQQALDFPADEAYGYLANSLPGGRTRITQLVNL